MSYLRGPNRNELQLLPACLDDYVLPNAPVRFIDAFVEGLDFAALGFERATPADTGRPPYHPADLLKLYLYGYLNRIRSSRRLEAEASRNLEVLWLLRSLRPDFKTIADFRKDNRKAFKPLFKQFNLLCRKLGLFGAELVAIDGSKFKAVNNPYRHYTQKQLAELVQKIESRIDQYLSELDAQDVEGQGMAGSPSRQHLAEQITRLKESKGHYDQLLSDWQAGGYKELGLSDPDSRNLKGPHGQLMGYNVQVAVDAKHDLIVAEEVTQAANDVNQLSPLALAAKQALQVEQLEAVADKGYYSADQLATCEAAGIRTFVPEPDRTSGQGNGGVAVFPKEAFDYDAAADRYRCPAGRHLPHAMDDHKGGQERLRYYDRAACRDCGLKSQCTTGAYRRITRRPHEEVAERVAARVAAHPQKVARRKEMVEHVFGTLRNWGHDHFLMKGVEKVRAEFSLSALTYNLRRVLNVTGLEQLMVAMGAQAPNIARAEG
jgi:transposase